MNAINILGLLLLAVGPLANAQDTLSLDPNVPTPPPVVPPIPPPTPPPVVPPTPPPVVPPTPPPVVPPTPPPVVPLTPPPVVPPTPPPVTYYDSEVRCFSPDPSHVNECTQESDTITNLLTVQYNWVYLNNGLAPAEWVVSGYHRRRLGGSQGSRKLGSQTCSGNYCSKPQYKAYCKVYCGSQLKSVDDPTLLELMIDAFMDGVEDLLNSTLPLEGQGRDRALEGTADATSGEVDLYQMSRQMEDAAYVGYQEAFTLANTSIACKSTIQDLVCQAQVKALATPQEIAASCVPYFCRMDFNSLQSGEWLGDVGCNANVKAYPFTSPYASGGSFGPYGNQVMVFNTSNPTGNRTMLGTPNQACGGPGVGSGGAPNSTGPNCRDLHQALIISQDGNTTNPKANSRGGTIKFEFWPPTWVEAVGVLNMRNVTAFRTSTNIFFSNKATPRIRLISQNNTVIATINVTDLGTNSFQSVKIRKGEVNFMEVKFMSEGAVPYVDVINTPPGC